jgi:hypothetical protein
VAACRRSAATTIRAIDLLQQFSHAERRPVNGAFVLAEHTVSGQSRTSLAVPVPGRITWTTALPRRAALRLDAAVAGDSPHAVARLRIGISDDRVYETLLEKEVSSDDTDRYGWTPLSAGLSRYAGPQFSLFYRPDGREWRVILSVDPVAGQPRVFYLGRPGIDTDADAAKRFFKRPR